MTLNGVNLTVVNKFKCLGSVVASTVSHDEEIVGRIGKAATSFGRLRNRVWENNKFTIKSKMLVYESCVLSSLLYGSETWTLCAEQKRLNAFHMRNLKKNSTHQVAGQSYKCGGVEKGRHARTV